MEFVRPLSTARHLHWLLAPQTLCPRHLTFLRETCWCCNRRPDPFHWRSHTKCALACGSSRKLLAQRPREHLQTPEQARQILASFEQSLLSAIYRRRIGSTDSIWFRGHSAEHFLQIICDLLWLLTRPVGEYHLHHCIEGSHFRPHYRWRREPKAKPWLGDLQIRSRRSVLAMVAIMLGTETDRRILQRPGWHLRTEVGGLHRFMTLEDQKELQHRIGLWQSEFRPLAAELLVGIQSTVPREP
jgi:hypothetical protein